MPALWVGQDFQEVIGLRLVPRRQSAKRQALMQRQRLVRGRFVRRRGLLRRWQTPPPLSLPKPPLHAL
jgi:hypothetical protein